MYLFIVVIAIGFIQVWGGHNPFHKDAWFKTFSAKLAEVKFLQQSTMLLTLATIFLPLIFLALLLAILYEISAWLAMPLGLLVLLYSFGRGEFTELVQDYTRACYGDHWQTAVERAEELGTNTQDLLMEGVEPAEENWQELHKRVFQQAAYKGFERLFAVLFWFLVLGPIGALMYRLLFIYNSHLTEGKEIAERWLWIMEWPAVRVLGISFALTGNFVGCFNRWREHMFCVKSPTEWVISESVLGALTVEENLVQSCAVTRKELGLLHGLYARTLWLWLAAISLFIIVR